MANEITLLICGTQEGNAGFSELLIVGNTPLAKEDVTYPNQFAASDYCINVCHTNDYIKYTLLCNPSIIKSVGASRGGRLSFSLTIKRGYRLFGDKTPFDLLNAIMKEFMGRNMSLSIDGAYTFKAGMYDPQPFKQIISIYADCLQENKRYILMSGDSNAHMVIPNEADIRNFLEDTQYEKLASYNSIWIGTKGFMEGAMNLDIPRPQEFTVLVNGVKKGIIRNSERFEQTIKAPKPTLNDFCLEFTLEDLRKKVISNPSLKYVVDDTLEVIKFTVEFVQKEFQRTIEFDFSDLSEDNINNVKESLRLIHATSTFEAVKALKEIHVDQYNKAIVTFTGDEIELDWTIEGDKNYLYTFSNNSSHVLQATSYATVKRKFKGIVFTNVPVELRKFNNLEFTIKLKYQPQRASYALQKGQSEGQMLVNAPELNLMSDSDVESIVFKEIIGYSIEQPRDIKLKPNGWLYVVMPIVNKVTSVKTVERQAGQQNGNIDINTRILNIDGIAEDTTVEVIFTGNADERLKIIKKFKKADEPYKGVIELPQKEYIQAIEFRIKGYHPERQSNISKKSSTIIVPDLKDFDPITLKEKIMGVINHFHIIQHVIIFILAFAIGFVVRPIIMGLIFPEQDKEQTEETNGSKGGNVGQTVEGEGTAASSSEGGAESDSGNGKPVTPPATVPARDQQQCDSFIEKCKNASLLFTEVSQLKNYINKFNDSNTKPNGYEELKEYYKHYDKAYTAIQRLGKQEHAGGFANIDSWKETCRKIDNDAKAISALDPFRKSLQAIYLNPSNIPTNNENYLGEIVFVGIDLSSYNSFIKLQDYKKNNFNE